ncbi:MAG: class IV adenylate cyclase [Vitreoscilla sp.]
MARNVEIKARVADMDALRARAAAIADSGPVQIPQDDTFFGCDNGRLKLRVFENGHGELIFYRRPDAGGPKVSFYVLSPTTSPDTLREALTLANGQQGRVVKHRTLFLVGRTRVHLDRVQGLGDFMELEVVLGEDESVDDGVREAHELMARLRVPAECLVQGAYHDLLRAG